MSFMHAGKLLHGCIKFLFLIPTENTRLCFYANIDFIYEKLHKGPSLIGYKYLVSFGFVLVGKNNGPLFVRTKANYASGQFESSCDVPCKWFRLNEYENCDYLPFRSVI